MRHLSFLLPLSRCWAVCRYVFNKTCSIVHSLKFKDSYAKQKTSNSENLSRQFKKKKNSCFYHRSYDKEKIPSNGVIPSVLEPINLRNGLKMNN